MWSTRRFPGVVFQLIFIKYYSLWIHVDHIVFMLTKSRKFSCTDVKYSVYKCKMHIQFLNARCSTPNMVVIMMAIIFQRFKARSTLHLLLVIFPNMSQTNTLLCVILASCRC
jgi:hypothetical protein